jgi:hypothetical protein
VVKADVHADEGVGWDSSNQYTCFRLELTNNRITVMKTSVKRIVVAVVSTVGLIVVLLGVLLFVAFSETGKMTPVETGQVAPNVFAVKDGIVNLYLMDFGDGYVAFDAGSDPAVVLQEMASLSIQPDEVKAVFLTHSDFDHTAALEEFAQATVFLPELEEQMMEGLVSSTACSTWTVRPREHP